jgi:Sec-independent protein secretion pathway component TatC
MLRIALEFAVLLTAPALLYVAYTVLISGTHASAREALRGAPLVLLFFVGIALVFFALVVFRSREEATAGKAYTPPSYKDGKITPGQIR